MNHQYNYTRGCYAKCRRCGTKRRAHPKRRAYQYLAPGSKIWWSKKPDCTDATSAKILADARRSTILRVAWTPSEGATMEDLLRNSVLCDIGVIDPPLSAEELQSVAYAAKRAVGEQLRRRAR